jgi:hypothetical protein
MTAWKDKNLYDRITDRQKKLEKQKGYWEPQLEDIAEFTRPDLTAEVDDQGKFVGSSIYEGTPVWAARTMARGFQGNMVSQSVEWLRHAMPELFFKGNDEVNKWLQAITEHMLSVYKRSNYYSVLPQHTLSGITIGSPILIAEEDLKTSDINCIIPHYKENYISRNWLGEDDVYHRKFKKSAKEAARIFNKDDLSLALQNALKQGNHYQEFEFIRAIYAYDDAIFDDLNDKDVEFTPNRPWMAYYIQVETDVDKKKPLPSDESPGYFSKPFSSWHYYRNEHETYARTPAWMAIYDIKMGQQMWKTLLESAHKTVNPALWVMANMKGRLRTMPGARNWVERAEDYDRPPVPVQEKFDYNIGKDIHESTQKAIERHFHIDLFKMLTRLIDERKAPPTATQILGMEGEQAVLLSAGVESYERDLLNPVDDRFMEIEGRSFRLPEPPEIVLEYSEGRIDPEFIGPLSQTQKLHYTVRKIHNALGAAEPIFAMFPNSIHKVKPEILIEKILEGVGLPQDAIRSNDDYYKLVDAIMQAQAEAEAIESGKTIAEGVSKLQGPTDATSPLAAIAGAV